LAAPTQRGFNSPQRISKIIQFHQQLTADAGDPAAARNVLAGLARALLEGRRALPPVGRPNDAAAGAAFLTWSETDRFPRGTLAALQDSRPTPPPAWISVLWRSSDALGKNIGACRLGKAGGRSSRSGEAGCPWSRDGISSQSGMPSDGADRGSVRVSVGALRAASASALRIARCARATVFRWLASNQPAWTRPSRAAQAVSATMGCRGWLRSRPTVVIPLRVPCKAQVWRADPVVRINRLLKALTG
jgi:hypothetical protein